MENENIQKNKLNRQRKKELKKKLINEMGENRKILYFSSFLSWIQFLVRVICFGIIAKGFSNFYNKIEFNVMKYAGFILVLNILGFLISSLSKKYQGLASQFARDSLKIKFFNAFSKNSDKFSKDYSYSDALTIASQGIDSLDTFYSNYMSTVIRTYLNCATILLLVVFIFPVGSLVFILSIPFIPVSIMLIQKRSANIMQRYWSTYMDVNNLFIDDLKGLNTLYSYSADAVYEKNFNKSAEDFRLSTMELLKFQLQSVGYMDAIMYLGIAISGLLAVNSIYNGGLSIFSFIFFILIATEFFMPIRELGYCMHLLMMNTKMADRIFTFLDNFSQEENLHNIQCEIEEIEKIEISNLSFSYDNTNQERIILQDINFVAEKDKIITIAGESGLGKSTIAKILFKKIEYYTGDILIDEKSLRNINKEEINKLGFYVSSDSYLFNESIMDNLKKATKYNDNEIKQWIKEKGILSFVNSLPNGLDTYVGENGKLISPGQRQQIICARALLANRKFYVFDEITSSVDIENEKIIWDMINLISKNSIVIVISHKMKQVQKSDYVLFLEKNNKWQFGKPENLYNSSIGYKELLDKQIEMEEILNGK